MSETKRESEFAAARKWINKSFCLPTISDSQTNFPVSFQLNSQPSLFHLQDWSAHREVSRQEQDITCETISLANSLTDLECRVVITTYHDYPAVEWVAYLKNTGDRDTAILSDILPLDVLFPLEAAAACQVHHARGGLTQYDDFEPLTTPLTFRQGGSKLELSARTGKSSTLQLPFFNLEMGGGGVIGAIGWSGGLRMIDEVIPKASFHA